MPTGSDPVQVSECVEISDAGTATVVRIGGELDVAVRASIEAVLLRAVQSASRVVVDLEGLTFCDSNGIAALVAAHHAAAASGAVLTVRNVSPRLRRLLDITGISDLIDATDRDAAPPTVVNGTPSP